MTSDGIKYLGSLRKPVSHSNGNGVKRDADGNHPSYRPPPKAVTISEHIGRLSENMRSSKRVPKQDVDEALAERLFEEGESYISTDRLSNDAYNQILLNSASSMLVQGVPSNEKAALLLD